MGWEYRIFFEAGDAPRLFSDQELPAAATAAPERRTDNYLPHSASVGVKLRGGYVTRLELKKRLEVDELGFEKWEKLKFKGGMAELEAYFAAEGLEPCIGGGSGGMDSGMTISLEKIRAQACTGGMILEETGVLLRFCAAAPTGSGSPGGGGGGGGGEGGSGSVGSSERPAEAWRSVAVEGKRKACSALHGSLERRVRNLVAAHNPGGRVLVCGYAEFVVAAAERVFAATPPAPAPAAPSIASRKGESPTAAAAAAAKGSEAKAAASAGGATVLPRLPGSPAPLATAAGAKASPPST